MCGRQRCSLEPSACVQAASSLIEGNVSDTWHDREAYRPSDNVSPGFSTPVVRIDDDEPSSRVLHTMRWGLVPSFTKGDAKPDFWRMFNARSEGVTNSPVFRRLLPRRRCVVLTQGFYEWRKEHASKAKQPYYIHLKGEQPFAFAGLYDSWTDAEGQKMFTYTILTTNSSKRLEWLHDRMPVLLRSRDACAKWLTDPWDSVSHFLQPYDEEDMVWFPVTQAINRAGYSGSDCCKPLNRPTVATFFQKPPAPAKPHAAAKVKDEAEQQPQEPTASAGKSEAEAEIADHPTEPSAEHQSKEHPTGRKRGPQAPAKASPAKKSKGGATEKPTKAGKGQPSMLSFFQKAD